MSNVVLEYNVASLIMLAEYRRVTKPNGKDGAAVTVLLTTH
jgi:hypothetical protein